MPRSALFFFYQIEEITICIIKEIGPKHSPLGDVSRHTLHHTKNAISYDIFYPGVIRERRVSAMKCINKWIKNQFNKITGSVWFTGDKALIHCINVII